MITHKTVPIDQERPGPSVPLQDANLGLDNANWQKGLQSESDWVWSGNLNPVPFPNHLARYFLQIPGVFEQQLNYSTTLIFDEPSFKNGIQISGFLGRVSRELAISYIAQRRRCQYSMTHHAILGYLTASKHGLTETEYRDKWAHLENFERYSESYTKLEIEVLRFAAAFSSNPKSYSDEDLGRLKKELRKDAAKRHPKEGRFLDQLRAAKAEWARALFEGFENPSERSARSAMKVDHTPSDKLLDQIINAQLIELSFLCLQFIGLTCVLTGLNIPDEDFLPAVMQETLPSEVIEAINNLNHLKGNGMQDLLPPKLGNLGRELIQKIEAGELVVEPVALKGTRVPLVSYESPEYVDRDKGVTVGGINVGTYGWGFGLHFPGSLVYALMHHPELARYEAPYSLPVLFNEDEWRNGTQNSGFVTRRLKEIVIQKVYKLNRSRYGIEHHTIFLYNTYLDEHGVGQLNPVYKVGTDEFSKAREAALLRAHATTLWISDFEHAPDETFSELEICAMRWTESLLRLPHDAHLVEPDLRTAFKEENDREIKAGLRILDQSGGIGENKAKDRLIEHQVAELCMMIGHMDGLGRAMTMLRLESESSVAPFDFDPKSFEYDPADPKRPKVKPKTGSDGKVKMTGYYNFRFGLFDILRSIGINDAVLTLNELSVNPGAIKIAEERMKKSRGKPVKIKASEIKKTGEF